MSASRQCGLSIPALLTSAVSGPNVSSAARKSFSTSSSRDTSACTATRLAAGLLDRRDDGLGGLRVARIVHHHRIAPRAEKLAGGGADAAASAGDDCDLAPCPLPVLQAFPCHLARDGARRGARALPFALGSEELKPNRGDPVSETVQHFAFAPDGEIPNNALPLLLYPQALARRRCGRRAHARRSFARTTGSATGSTASSTTGTST